MPVRIGRAHVLQGGGSGGQLAAGVRAGPGLVGYLGIDAALTTYTSAGAAPPGMVWNTGPPAYLTTTADNVVVDHAKIFGEVLLRHANLTFTNSQIFSGSGAIYTVHGDTGSSGLIKASDTLIERLNAATNNVSSAVSSFLPSVELVRCEIRGTMDAVQPNIVAGNTLKVSQCWIHDLFKGDANQHLDCVQPFQAETSGASSAVTVEHCWLDAIGSGSTAIVTPNSAITLGQATAGALEQYNPVLINNCYLAGGSYHLRVYQNTGNITVTGNKFGPIVAFGTHVVENPGGIVLWSGNTDNSGAPLAM